MKYFTKLEQNKENIQEKIEELFNAYQVQEVDSGYINCITLTSNIEKLVEAISSLGILIYVITWWCHTTDESTKLYDCPHGLGGPLSHYYPGWFSETEMPAYEVEDKLLDIVDEEFDIDKITKLNQNALNYVFNDVKQHWFYSECMQPAIWLYVPDEWIRNDISRSNFLILQ